ncbi:MAG: DJ-1/PfpI family protein [Clostridia bacterium]|nr:DJ-1/PfpI family protein [Clostridia bacterium]
MIVVLLAEGFEEIEALTPVDMLRRAGCEVKLVGVNSYEVEGSHGIKVKCDAIADDILLDDVDMAIFPGGMPGTLNLDSASATDLIINALMAKGGHIAAICAAPLVLGKRGLLKGKRATCYPGFEGLLLGASLSQSSVVTDGNITTAKGMGVALEFSKELVRIATNKETAVKVADSVMEYSCLSGAGAVEIVEPMADSKPEAVEEDVEYDFSDYKLPKTSLIKSIENTPDENVQEEIQGYADKILDTLASFDVYADIKEVDRGPTLTRFSLVPLKGVKVSKIVNLADDIALCLAAGSVRVEAPIPGKAAIGFEIPNRNRQIVGLREMLESEEFLKMTSKTSVCIGVDVCSKPVFGELESMPHAIVGGATGMGKSVAINSMLISMLYKATPEELKLILIDPKQVEFTLFDGIPHLLTPIISQPKEAAAALRWAVEEMERRYQILSDALARNLNAYNAKVDEDPTVGKKLPKIVIVIDELADLMLQVRDSVEGSIVSLAQKARAAGIHLIIGTQRPSTNVLPATVKANIPTRIACKVSTIADSRVLLDASGAEKLMNRGDMLVSLCGSSKPVRVQGAYVSDSDIAAVTDYLKSEYGSAYNRGVIEKIKKYEKTLFDKKQENKEEGNGLYDALHDPKFLEAVELALSTDQVSTSLLQRKLSIGYGKAAVILDIMCELGIISEPNGSKPRRVLMSAEEWHEKLAKISLD